MAGSLRAEASRLFRAEASRLFRAEASRLFRAEGSPRMPAQESPRMLGSPRLRAPPGQYLHAPLCKRHRERERSKLRAVRESSAPPPNVRESNAP